MNLPNKLTVFRIILVPILIALWLFPYAELSINMGYIDIGHISLPIKNIVVVFIFIIASITDFVDGYIARRDNIMTTFGKFADPIADKLLVNTMLILLADSGYIHVLVVILMILRDTLVDGMRMIAASSGVVVSAGYLGKLKTVSQMVLIIFALLGNLPFELYSLPITDFIMWFATFVSLASGISYFIQLKDYIFESK